MSCQRGEQGRQAGSGRGKGKWKTLLCALCSVHENDYELFYGVFKCLYVIFASNKTNTQAT